MMQEERGMVEDMSYQQSAQGIGGKAERHVGDGEVVKAADKKGVLAGTTMGASDEFFRLCVVRGIDMTLRQRKTR